MKNWTTCMTMIVGFFIAFFHCNSYAYPNTVEKFPFKILQDDENFYHKVTTLKKQKDLTIDQDDVFDEQYWATFMPDEENFSYANPNSNNKRYLRAATESLILLGIVSAYYWGTR